MCADVEKLRDLNFSLLLVPSEIIIKDRDVAAVNTFRAVEFIVIVADCL